MARRTKKKGKDMERLITNSHNLDVYSGVKKDESDEHALERAREYYRESVAMYEEIIKKQGNGKGNYWLNCRNSEQAVLDSLRIETEDDYFARVRKVYLNPPASEITKERWWKMLEVLPPCGYMNTERYSMFYVSEALQYTYHDFYLYDKKTGKYWSKTCDACDKSTWLDVVLGLRAA